MGCSSSGLSRVSGRTSRRSQHIVAGLQRLATTGFTCYLSHYSVEAESEARFLKRQLEESLEVLDAAGAVDLDQMQEQVRESKCVLLLQSQFVLTRLWRIVELVTAIDAGVPIVGVLITPREHQYDFAYARTFMTHLDTLLHANTRAQLHALGIDTVDAAFKLSSIIPSIISVPLDLNDTALTARLNEIVGAMDRAVPHALTEDRDTWLARRGSAPEAPLRGRSLARAAETPEIFGRHRRGLHDGNLGATQPLPEPQPAKRVGFRLSGAASGGSVSPHVV